jgi:hypothetical protein
LILASAYFVYDFFMQVGVDQNMLQPIHYSQEFTLEQMVLIVNIVTHQE